MVKKSKGAAKVADTDAEVAARLALPVNTQAWDFTNPAFVDALAIAQRQRPRNVSPLQAAELICIADQMLWYQQVRNWASVPPTGAPAFWQNACVFLVDLINRGWNAEHRTWWYVRPDEMDWYKVNIVSLMTFGLLIKQLRQDSTMTISAALDVAIDIIAGPSWEARLKELIKVKLASKETEDHDPVTD